MHKLHVLYADDKAHEAELSCDQVAMDSAMNEYQLNLEHNTSPAECSKHCLIEHKYNASSWSSCTTTYTKRVAVALWIHVPMADCTKYCSIVHVNMYSIRTVDSNMLINVPEITGDSAFSVLYSCDHCNVQSGQEISQLL